MIHTEFFRTREDGVNLIRIYSDEGLMIRKDQSGELYEESIDIEGIGYTYTETDIPIEDEIADSEALEIIMGRDGDEPQAGDDVPEGN